MRQSVIDSGGAAGAQILFASDGFLFSRKRCSSNEAASDSILRCKLSAVMGFCESSVQRHPLYVVI